jgi:oligoribonuclease
MKFLALSVITTGPDYSRHDPIEIGMMVEDSTKKLDLGEIPCLRIWVDKESYRGHPIGIVQNTHIFEKICDLREKKSLRLVEPDNIFTRMTNFLRPHFAEFGVIKTPIVLAGWQFNTYDKPFLSKIKGYAVFPFSDTVLDPAGLYFDFAGQGAAPSIIDAKNMAGIEIVERKNDSLANCWDTIQLLRAKY